MSSKTRRQAVQKKAKKLWGRIKPKVDFNSPYSVFEVRTLRLVEKKTSEGQVLQQVMAYATEAWANHVPADEVPFEGTFDLEEEE